MRRNLRKLLQVLTYCGVAALAPMSADAQTYCTPTSTSIYGDYISSFSTTGAVGNITNNGTSGSSYVYYPSQTMTAILGTTINFSVSFTYTQYINIWIDLNQNGSFADAGENLRTSTSKMTSSPGTGTFTIPLTGMAGNTRMRVQADYSTANPGPCGGGWGETEDYNVTLISPCAGLPGANPITVNPIFARSANATWTAVTGSAGYEYIVKTNATTPTGAGTPVTANSANLVNLNPATQYWLFVRNKCNATDASMWSVKSFMTSNCSAPQVSFANIKHNSALALWSSINIATKYEYICNTDPNAPAVSATGTTTTTNNVLLQNLEPETAYYMHVRTHCTGNEMSSWDTYQFTTMKECVPPVVTPIPSSLDNIEVTWQPVETAVAYEYAVNSMETPPSLGTTEYDNSVTVNLPADKKPYYFHIRSKCISIYTASEWTTIQLREGEATAVNNVNDNGARVQAYPNPVSDVITIQVDGVSQLRGTVLITDISGKIMATTDVTDKKTNISMSGFAPGIYLVKYFNGLQAQTFRVNKL
ncbi:MAG: T9SS type A sorting domain-containing protein [Sphingobacteriales bacterium]|nr:MAG: T9SS type A sorting domain-containing protein [Sphingobacteriales bacterium]